MLHIHMFLRTYPKIIFVDILCGHAAQNINEKQLFG